MSELEVCIQCCCWCFRDSHTWNTRTRYTPRQQVKNSSEQAKLIQRPVRSVSKEVKLIEKTSRENAKRMRENIAKRQQERRRKLKGQLAARKKAPQPQSMVRQSTTQSMDRQPKKIVRAGDIMWNVKFYNDSNKNPLYAELDVNGVLSPIFKELTYPPVAWAQLTTDTNILFYPVYTDWANNIRASDGGVASYGGVINRIDLV